MPEPLAGVLHQFAGLFKPVQITDKQACRQTLQVFFFSLVQGDILLQLLQKGPVGIQNVVQRLAVVLGRFKNEFGLDLVCAVVGKPDGYLFERVIALLVAQAQVYVFLDHKGIGVVADGDLV